MDASDYAVHGNMTDVIIIPEHQIPAGMAIQVRILGDGRANILWRDGRYVMNRDSPSSMDCPSYVRGYTAFKENQLDVLR